MDYPGEWTSSIRQRYGIDIKSYAKVHADWGFHHEEEYSIDVQAVETPRRTNTVKWSRRASKSLTDKYFDRYTGQDAEDLKNWDADNVRSQFSRGRARGSIDQTLRSGSGSTNSESDPGYASSSTVN
ncbi:hypothetical protein J4G08_05900 [Candidatus Poribacteria bacterium]|nr:hypothetical protein [Candidatus Poribacteria bacterium]